MMASTLPRLAENCDLRSLPIGPVEAFLLSRVDGCSNIEDLANATGIPEDTVREHLTRLAELGAVELGGIGSGTVSSAREHIGQEGRAADGTAEGLVREHRTGGDTAVRAPGGQGQGDSSTRFRAETRGNLGTVGAATDTSPQAADVGPRARLRSPLRSGSSPPPRVPEPPGTNGLADASLRPPRSTPPPTDEPFKEFQRSLKPEYDRELLEEQNDLPVDFRKRVLKLLARLDSTNHYELLGVHREASKSEIKAAYFAKVQEFHGDRFFNRDLGSYKRHIDRIFAAMTRAHDTLTRKKTRGEYDSYLRSVEETLGLGRMPAGVPFVDVNGIGHAGPGALSSSPPPPDRETEANLVDPGEGLRAPKLPSGFGVSKDKVSFEQTPIVGPGGLHPSSGHKTTSPEARRQLAARKLRGTLLGDLAKGAKKSTESPPPKRDPEDLKAASRELKARLSIPAAHGEKLARRYLDIAAEAEQAGEWASAANALRTAAELLPDDEDLARRLEAAKLEVDRRFAARFKDQAAYEERDGQFERAALTYERAARGKNSAELYQKAASCMLRAGTHGRKAVELGRQAVTLDPESIKAHLTLARAFFSAGMSASAIAEVSRALELDPKNEQAKKLQKDFKKSM